MFILHLAIISGKLQLHSEESVWVCCAVQSWCHRRRQYDTDQARRLHRPQPLPWHWTDLVCDVWLCRLSGKLAKSCKYVTFSTQISGTTMRKTSIHMFTHIFRLSNSMSQTVDNRYAAQVRINFRVPKIYQDVALVESLIYKRWRCSIAACALSVRQALKNPGNPDHPWNQAREESYQHL